MNKMMTAIRRFYRRYTVLTAAQREWVRDLRSGEFPQGKRQLQSSEGFCCLGVACKTYERVTGNQIARHDDGRVLGFYLDSQDGVQQWLGLLTHQGVFGTDATQALSVLNDNGSTFAEIADFIEDNAEKLFRQKN